MCDALLQVAGSWSRFCRRPAYCRFFTFSFTAANNYATCLAELERSKEARSLLRKTIPVARRVLGENDDLTLKMRRNYAQSLYKDASATLDDLREAVRTLEDVERIARRVLGGAHPLTSAIELNLQNARAALRAHEETQPSGDA